MSFRPPFLFLVLASVAVIRECAEFYDTELDQMRIFVPETSAVTF